MPPRIAVIGSANIDLTTFTDHFPAPGETIFGQRFDLGFGGKGANQAAAARLCGADVFMIARVGNDLFGPATIENFRKLGIDTTHVTAVEASSGVAPIFVEPSGQNRIIVVKGANDALLPPDVDAASELLKTMDCIVLQLEIPLETVYYAASFARRNGIRCIVNPAPAQAIDLTALAGIDYLIPNESEAAAIAQSEAPDLVTTEGTIEGARDAAKLLLSRGIRRVIVTLGENGSLLASPEAIEHCPAYPVSSIDSSGAGDAFIGSFAAFLCEGLDERDAVRRANLYAALSTTAIGTQKSFPDRARFERECEASESANLRSR
jgi:ribokinase